MSSDSDTFVIHSGKYDNRDEIISCLRTISTCINYKNSALRRINAFLQLYPDFEFEREIIFAKNYIKENKIDKASEIILKIKDTLYKRLVGKDLISNRLKNNKDMGTLANLDNNVLENIFA
jgi:hypothetical protein